MKGLAVITGGASGLGAALASEAARRGYALALGDVAEGPLRATAEALRAQGASVVTERCDVRDEAQLEALAQTGEAAFGPLRLWVNNAGVAVSGDVGVVPLADVRRVVDINLWGVMAGCHVAAPRLRAQQGGAILNVASAAGLVSTPGMGVYNATKAAVVALSETLALELASSGVNVTVVCPTFFQTGILDSGVHMAPARLKVPKKLMQKSKIQAPEVAKAALDGAEAGTLYVVPMTDGAWLWRVKRLWPEGFVRHLMPRGLRAWGG